MDYKIKFFHFLFCVFATFILVGCDTDVSPEPLQIIGTPPETLYYDSVFQYTFGASGGDGTYRYRYIQIPDTEEDQDTTFNDNPVEMTIEVIDGAKPSFILRGIPRLPNDTSFDELNNTRHKYQLELTDGINTVVRDFEFSLNKNTLNFLEDLSINEGVVNNRVVSSLNTQLAVNNTSVCNQVADTALEKRINEFGETVYPYAFQVSTDTRTASKTELFYRFTTRYQESLPERASVNIGNARKGVDYVDAERSIILEPNKARCLAYIEILEDLIIEGEETLSIEFYKSIGGAIDLSLATVDIDIRDNEIRPKYLSSNIVRNRGDKIVVPIILDNPVNFPISLNIAIDSENTTAGDEDYTLEPQGGVVTLQPGETQASYTVTLLENPSQIISDALNDKLISIKTDLDDILDVEPYTIEINEWARSSDISKEIVGGVSSSEQVVDFAINGDGIITTLTSDTLNGNIVAKLKSFNRDSSVFNFTAQGSVMLSRAGQDIKPISIEANSEGDSHRLVIVLSVDNLYADVFRGGLDFVVMNYTRVTGEPFILDSVKQYGSEGNDRVEGTAIRNSTLYVYGQTNGFDFEGNPSSDTNAGGNDGFIYSIDLQSNKFNWARLVGTNNDDRVSAIDIGNRDLVASVSTLTTDEDVYIKRFDASTGLDRLEDSSAEIATNRDDIAGAIKFDRSASGYRVLLESDADLSSQNELTPSLSKDVQLLTFNSDNERSSTLSFATELDDFAKGLNTMPDNNNLIVTGETLGQFSDNLKRGDGDIDLFTSILGLENSSNLLLEKSIQFGTIEDDTIISVKPVSNTKYFVLWKESFTNAPLDTYRISAFSIDGKKLSRDP